MENLTTTPVGEDALTVETEQSERWGDWMAVCQLRTLKYDDDQIARQMGITVEKIGELDDEFDPGTE